MEFAVFDDTAMQEFLTLLMMRIFDRCADYERRSMLPPSMSEVSGGIFEPLSSDSHGKPT